MVRQQQAVLVGACVRGTRCVLAIAATWSWWPQQSAPAVCGEVAARAGLCSSSAVLLSSVLVHGSDSGRPGCAITFVSTHCYKALPQSHSKVKSWKVTNVQASSRACHSVESHKRCKQAARRVTPLVQHRRIRNQKAEGVTAGGIQLPLPSDQVEVTPTNTRPQWQSAPMLAYRTHSLIDHLHASLPGTAGTSW